MSFDDGCLQYQSRNHYAEEIGPLYHVLINRFSVPTLLLEKNNLFSCDVSKFESRSVSSSFAQFPATPWVELIVSYIIWQNKH